MNRPIDTSKPIIALRDIELTVGSAAGQVNILRGIDLTVDAGETVSILGPSGSGKSSMMMVIAGLERATAGAIEVAGFDLNGLDEDGLAAMRRDRVGIVFQSFHLVPTMTALENVALPLEFAGLANAFDLARDGLAAVGLDHRLQHYPGQLSGGEQQRVALARAFAPRPNLLLADEPTGNLDGNTGGMVMDLLFQRVQDTSATLMLITHDEVLAARCARRVQLRDGRIVDDRITAGGLSVVAGE